MFGGGRKTQFWASLRTTATALFSIPKFLVPHLREPFLLASGFNQLFLKKKKLNDLGTFELWEQQSMNLLRAPSRNSTAMTSVATCLIASFGFFPRISTPGDRNMQFQWITMGFLKPTEPFWVDNHCRPASSGSFQQGNIRCRKATAKSNSWRWQWIHHGPEATFQLCCVSITSLNLCHQEGTAIRRSYCMRWHDHWVYIDSVNAISSLLSWFKKQNNQNRLEGPGPRSYC